MPSSSIYVAANGRIFFFNGRTLCYHCVYTPHFLKISFSARRHLELYHLLVVWDMLWEGSYLFYRMDLASFGYRSWGGLAESHVGAGSSFSKTFHSVLCSGCTNFHSRQCHTGLFFLCILASTFCLFVFDNRHCDWMRWYLIVVLICISLMINGCRSSVHSLLRNM